MHTVRVPGQYYVAVDIVTEHTSSGAVMSAVILLPQCLRVRRLKTQKGK